MSSLEFLKVALYFIFGVIGPFILWNSYTSGNWEEFIGFLFIGIWCDVIIKYAIKNRVQKESTKHKDSNNP